MIICGSKACGKLRHLLSGDWAGLRLYFDTIEIKGSGEMPFEVKLNDVELTISSEESAISIAGSESYFIEMGQSGWLSQDIVDDAENNLIDANHPLIDEIRNSLTNESAIFLDDDQDGLLSEEEREEQLLASGGERSDHLSSGDDEIETTDDD